MWTLRVVGVFLVVVVSVQASKLMKEKFQAVLAEAHRSVESETFSDVHWRGSAFAVKSDRLRAALTLANDKSKQLRDVESAVGDGAAAGSSAGASDGREDAGPAAVERVYLECLGYVLSCGGGVGPVAVAARVMHRQAGSSLTQSALRVCVFASLLGFAARMTTQSESRTVKQPRRTVRSC